MPDVEPGGHVTVYYTYILRLGPRGGEGGVGGWLNIIMGFNLNGNANEAK